MRMVPAFEPGKTYRFVSESRIRMQLPGRGIREAIVEQQSRIDSMARDDGRPGVSLRARIERLKVEFRSGEKKILYDSFKEEDRSSKLGQHFRHSLNRWVDLKTSPDLQIVEVSHGGLEGLGTLIPGVPQFGLNDLEKLVAEIPQGLPENAVVPGETWQIEGRREVTDVGELEFDVSYRYLGPVDHEGNTCFEIEVGGQIGGDAIISESGGSLADKELSFRGSSLTGRILFDPTVSVVRLREQTVSMLMELPSQGEGTPAVQIPVEQQATIRLLHVVPTS